MTVSPWAIPHRRRRCAGQTRRARAGRAPPPPSATWPRPAAVGEGIASLQAALLCNYGGKGGGGGTRGNSSFVSGYLPARAAGRGAVLRREAAARHLASRVLESGACEREAERDGEIERRKETDR
jgi:hypothetical protein